MQPTEGVVVMPREESLLRRIERDVVSKAAFRSRKMRMVISLASAVRRRSLVTFRRAVSVLWVVRNQIERFQKTIMFQMLMKLRGNYFLEYFLNEGEIGDGSKVAKDGWIGTRFFLKLVSQLQF